MRCRRETTTAVLVLALATLNPRPAGADGDQAVTNLAQFVQIAGVLQGFTPRGEVWRGQLTPGEATLITEELMTGNEYLVLATGDLAATDVDLELFDSELNPIDADHGDDNTPLVSVTPDTSAIYHVRVTLVSATAPAAWYALQVMYR